MNSSTTNVLIAFLLNLLFALIEFLFGVLFNSSAVLADAVHDMGDAVAIGLSWYLEKVSSKKQDIRYTLGYKRFSLLGAMITAGILMMGSTMIILENTVKIFKPEPVNHQGMLVLGLIAIVINLIASKIVKHGHTENEGMLSLHFLEDTMGWLAVIAVSLILRVTDWYFLDPLLSVLISLFILSKTLPKFVKNLQIFLEKAPEDLHLDELRLNLLAIDGVKEVCQFNVWSLDGRRHVAMAHLIIERDAQHSLIKDRAHHLFEDYQIVESAIELDYSQLEHQHHLVEDSGDGHAHHHH